MKKLILFTIGIMFLNSVFADIPSGYYDSADGLSGDALKSALHDIIDGHTVKTYTEVWDILKESDEDPNNTDNFILIYTNRSIPKSSVYPAFNREHVWAKSHGFPSEGDYGYTDAHHLRPSDVDVNSARGNLDFDNGGTLVNETSDCYKDGDSFEPRDEIKGDIARMMFYMTVRYEGDGNSSDDYDLELVDYVGTSGINFGKLSTLLEWHYGDPVDDIERHRNEVIYSYQHNRNPFIDHPEYVAQIWGGGGNMIPSISNITINPEYPTSSDNVSVSAEITDSDGTIESAELHWGISSVSLSNTIALTNSSENTYTTNTSIPAQDDGTTIYFEIEATDNEPETKTTSEQSYNIDDNPTFNIFYEDFETATVDIPIAINDWILFEQAGTGTWEGRSYDDNLYAQFSAYSTGEASNITWLITPEIDLSSIGTATLSFISKDAYNNGDPVDVYISINYSGTGDPNPSTWIDLNPTLATGSTSGYADNFTESGDIDITSYCGNTIYIAYKYTGGDPSLTTTMQIDDILITGKNSASGNKLPVISNVDFTPTTPISTENVTISATITDSDGSISTANIKWGTSSGSYPNTISMSNSADDYSGEIPMQSNGTTVYYIIQATDNEAGDKQSSEQSYTVNNLPLISNVLVNPGNPTATENVTVSATITDPNGSIISADLKWGTTSGSYTNTISMTNSGDNYSGEIPMQSYGTKIYFIIDALDNEAENKQTSEYEYTVNDLPVISDIELNPEIPASTENVTISATITDSDGSISTANIKWGTTSGSYPNTISMSNSDDDYSGEIPAQTAGTNVYYIIEATDNEAENKQTSEYNYTVNNLPIISNVSISPENPTEKDAVTASATISDSDGNISSANLKWGTEPDSYTNTISMSGSENTYSGEIPAQAASTTIYFLIEATDNLSEKVDYSNDYSVIETTGIIEFSNTNLKVYPNPVKDILHIELSDAKKIITIKLYNIVGEKVYEVSEFNSSEVSINLNSFAKGIYFIQVENENQSFVKKIIIK